MSQNQYGGKYAPKKKPWWQPFLPVIGLLLLLGFAALAYLVSAPIMALIVERVPNRTLPKEQLQLIVAIAVFVVEVLLLAAVYSVFQPKTPRGTTERELDREKKENIKEQQAANRRKKEMQAKMRAQNRNKDK